MDICKHENKVCVANVAHVMVTLSYICPDCGREWSRKVDKTKRLKGLPALW